MKKNPPLGPFVLVRAVGEMWRWRESKPPEPSSKGAWRGTFTLVRQAILPLCRSVKG
jgi:hypothetical protein